MGTGILTEPQTFARAHIQLDQVNSLVTAAGVDMLCDAQTLFDAFCAHFEAHLEQF